jgi:hypothetical protein
MNETPGFAFLFTTTTFLATRKTHNTSLLASHDQQQQQQSKHTHLETPKTKLNYKKSTYYLNTKNVSII